MPSSCALLGGFAIGAWVSLIQQRSTEREMSPSACTRYIPGFIFFPPADFLDVPVPRYALELIASYGVFIWASQNLREENPKFSLTCELKVDTLNSTIP